MKKILFIAVCCLCLCGCGKKELKTTCSISTEWINETRVIIHDGKSIKEEKWERIFTHKNLNSATTEENEINKYCKKQNYSCNIYRKGKTTTTKISFRCGKNTPNENSECDYLNQIKMLEDSGFNCIEEN